MLLLIVELEFDNLSTFGARFVAPLLNRVFGSVDEQWMSAEGLH
jgi:hypothetical protein